MASNADMMSCPLPCVLPLFRAGLGIDWPWTKQRLPYPRLDQHETSPLVSATPPRRLHLKYAKSGQRPYKGTLDALRRITKEEGIKGLYSGLAPSLVGITHVMIQFPLYEGIKLKISSMSERPPDSLQVIDARSTRSPPRSLRAARAVSGAAAGSLKPRQPCGDHLSQAQELIAASSLSKMVASTATYPHEVVRSHMHVVGHGPFVGFWRTVGLIYRQEGIPGFYRGCATNLIRTTPAAALTFTSFELMSSAIREWSGAHLAREKLLHRQAERCEEAEEMLQ